jgi:hypothetical protein
MNRFHTFIGLNFRAARWASVIAATTPNINPSFSIIGAAIVINELFL